MPGGAATTAGIALIAGMAVMMWPSTMKSAVAAGAIQATDTQRAALLIQQTVMYGWLMNRFVQNPQARVTAEDAWEFCLHGFGG